MKNKFTASCSKCGKPVLSGTGETNKTGNKWITEHLNADDCKSAAPSAQRRVGYGIGGYSSGYYGANEMWRDYYDYEDDNPYGPFSTSEDVNPNEGSK